MDLGIALKRITKKQRFTIQKLPSPLKQNKQSYQLDGSYHKGHQYNAVDMYKSAHVFWRDILFEKQKKD